MKTTFAAALLAVCAFGVVASAPAFAAAEPAQTKTYALIVANNGSVDQGVEPLRFADDDGARFYELFDSFVDEAFLLATLDEDSQRIFGSLAAQTRAPSRSNLRDRVQAIAEQIAADRGRGIESEVYLVFTGHGNVDSGGEGYLSLADGKLRRSDLYRDVIRPLDAGYTHLIIDACHAYFMVRSRGGDEWDDDRSGVTLDAAFEAYLEGDARKPAELSTVGVILSTSGAAEVHEWSKYRAGVFSHELRSGMLGAADADGDRNVSYRELEAYLVAANVAVTNARARINVFAEPPAQDRSRPLTRLDAFRDATTLVVPRGVGGRYNIEDARGLRYADMHIDPSAQTSIVLLRGPVGDRSYFLRQGDTQAEIPTSEASVRSTALAFTARRDQSRGSVEEAFRTNLFATPFGPAFVQGYSAGREVVGAQRDAETARAPQVTASSWSGDLWFEYAAGTPTLGHAGVQHNLAAAYDFVWADKVGVGPYLSYGFAPTDVGTFHRISGGIQLDRIFDSGSWEFGPRVRLGHQALFVDAGTEVGADTLGLRGEAALLFVRPVLGDFSVGLVGGASVDVVTQTSAGSTAERAVLNPFAGIGARF